MANVKYRPETMYGGAKRICANCRKAFEIPSYVQEWGYFYGSKICCGNSCMQEMRRKDKHRDKYASYYAPKMSKGSTYGPDRRVTDAERAEMRRLYAEGNRVAQIARMTSRSESVVKKAVKA